MKRLALFTLVLVALFVGTAQSTVREITPWKMDIDSQENIAVTNILTTPGSSDTVFVAGAHGADNLVESVTFTVTVTNINTNVVIRLLSGHESNHMGNIDETGTDTTITANGTYSFTITDVRSKGYFALYWVSSAGGNTAALRITVKVG